MPWCSLSNYYGLLAFLTHNPKVVSEGVVSTECYGTSDCSSASGHLQKYFWGGRCVQFQVLMGRFFFNAHFDLFHNFCVTFFKLLSLSKLGNALSPVSYARNNVLNPFLWKRWGQVGSSDGWNGHRQSGYDLKGPEYGIDAAFVCG